MGTLRSPLSPFLIASALLHLFLALLLPGVRLPRLAGPGGRAEIVSGPEIEVSPISPFLPLGALRLQVVEIEVAGASPAEDAAPPTMARETTPEVERVVEVGPGEEVAESDPQRAAPAPVMATGGAGSEAISGSKEAADSGVRAGSESIAGSEGAAGGGSAGQGAIAGGAQAPESGPILPPVMIAMSWPEYPAEARKRPSVPIVLEIHVTATGEVDAVKVENESGCPACERAAIASAWKLRFLPATRDGHPFAMWMRFPVTFRRR